MSCCCVWCNGASDTYLHPLVSIGPTTPVGFGPPAHALGPEFPNGWLNHPSNTSQSVWPFACMLASICNLTAVVWIFGLNDTVLRSSCESGFPRIVFVNLASCSYSYCTNEPHTNTCAMPSSVQWRCGRDVKFINSTWEKLLTITLWNSDIGHGAVDPLFDACGSLFAFLFEARVSCCLREAFGRIWPKQ